MFHPKILIFGKGSHLHSCRHEQMYCKGSRVAMAKICSVSICGRNSEIFINLVSHFACLMLPEGICILPVDQQLNWPTPAHISINVLQKNVSTWPA